MSKEAMKLALEAAYLAGLNASGEGYNGEYPFQDHNAHPEQDDGWVQGRDKYVGEALAEQPAPSCPECLVGLCHCGLRKAEQPAQQDIPDLIAGTLGVSRGTAYDLMREALAQQPEPAQHEPLPRILGVYGIGKTSLQLVFNTRSDADEYYAAIKEQP